MDDIQIELVRIIKICSERVYLHDKHLIDNNSSEMSIVFRLGLYVEELVGKTRFNSLNVDCEYNRDRGYSKRIRIDDEERNALFRPDLIIHQRGSNKHNLLAVEAKGYWNFEDRESDFKKLIGLTGSDNHYEYKLGVFLEFGLQNPAFNFFSDGVEVDPHE